MRRAACDQKLGHLCKQWYSSISSTNASPNRNGTHSPSFARHEDQALQCAAASPQTAGDAVRISVPWLLASVAGVSALGATCAWQEQAAGGHTAGKSAQAGSCLEKKWVQTIAAGNETTMVLSASTMHAHPLLTKDHLFSELHNHNMVEDLVCFYCTPEKRLDYVIQLGKNVCGFPKIVHGGLTAAIIDESFGFLWLSLRANKQLPFVGPAFTAHLEVDYKQKIPAGKLLLCKTEVEQCENRKLWMKATVCDGDSGKVYAVARALFVCPRTRKLIGEGVKYAYNAFFA